jgi:hypothetical protein
VGHQAVHRRAPTHFVPAVADSGGQALHTSALPTNRTRTSRRCTRASCSIGSSRDPHTGHDSTRHQDPRRCVTSHLKLLCKHEFAFSADKYDFVSSSDFRTRPNDHSEADHSPPSTPEAKNGGAIAHSPTRLHGIALHLLSNGTTSYSSASGSCALLSYSTI